MQLSLRERHAAADPGVQIATSCTIPAYTLWADWKLPVGARGHAEWPDLERAGPGARGRYSARVRLNLEFSAMAAHGSWTETTGRSPFASTAISWSLAAELSTGRYWDR